MTEEQKLVIYPLSNVRIMTTEKVLQEVLNDEAQKHDLHAMAQSVESARKGLGFSGDLPIMLMDMPDVGHYCAAGVYPLKTTVSLLSARFGAAITEDDKNILWPTQQGLEELAPCMLVSSGCLKEQSKLLNWDEFESVAAHEIGHIVRHDTNPLRDYTAGLSEELHNLALLRDFVVHTPEEQYGELKQAFGEKVDFLRVTDKLFQTAGEAVENILFYARDENGSHYAETLIDHLTSKEKSAELMERVHHLPTIPLADDALAKLSEAFPDDGNEKRAYSSSPPAILDVLEKAHSLAFISSAAVESLADDIATRHIPSGTQNLFNTFHHVAPSTVMDGPLHFSSVNRFARSKILSDTREKMMRTGGLHEAAATHSTNQAMRDIHDITQETKKSFLDASAPESTEAGSMMSSAQRAWVKRNMHASLDEMTEAAGGKQWINNVEGAGARIAHSQRTYTDRIRAEQAAKAEQENGR